MRDARAIATARNMHGEVAQVEIEEGTRRESDCNSFHDFLRPDRLGRRRGVRDARALATSVRGWYSIVWKCRRGVGDAGAIATLVDATQFCKLPGRRGGRRRESACNQVTEYPCGAVAE